MAYRPAQVYTGSGWDDIGDKRMLTHDHSGGADGANIPQSSVTDLTTDLASKADYPSGGSNGDLLTKSGTTTAWATPLRGLNLITVATATAVSSLAVSNVFSSTYSNYRITLESVCTVAAGLSLRFRDGSGDDTTSNYQTAGGYWTMGSGITNEGGTGQTSMQIGGLDATLGGAGIDIFLPNQSFATSVVSVGVSPGFGRIYLARFTTTKSFTGFSLIPATGLLSCTVRVYGYRES